MTTSRLGDFTAQADAYARTRPGYPLQLLDELIAHAHVSPGESVADLGAGTGLFTQLLAQRGLRVTAIEPNQAMRAKAPAMAGVTWAGGTFEATGLGERTQVWVTAAQAFHWADASRALPEVRRILIPDACFTILWNDRDMGASAVMRHTHDLILRQIPEFDELYRRDLDWTAILTSTGDFKNVARSACRHVVPMSRARYLDLWKSHNSLQVRAGPDRFAAFLKDVTDYLDECHVDHVDVTYNCNAWTARRT